MAASPGVVPPVRAGTPHSTESLASASGEPSSERAHRDLALAQHRENQQLMHQLGLGGQHPHPQQQHRQQRPAAEGPGDATMAAAAALSKAEHEALYGRAASTPASANAGSVRGPIVAHEDEDDAFRPPHGHRQPQHQPSPASGSGALPSHNMIATGRSPRLAPAAALSHVPELQGSTHASSSGAPTALMIMRRRRSNSHGGTGSHSDSTHGRRDELGGSNGISHKGSLGSSRHRSGSLGNSGSRHRSLGTAPQNSPGIQGAEAAVDPNEAPNVQQPPQQAQVYSGQAVGANPYHPHLTAMRYNSSLHSTLGGYPMGAPTQLTHPSVTLELIARDRARWEADYYTGGQSGYGMDYGYDYYNSGLRGVNGGASNGMSEAELERLQGMYRPRHMAPQERQQQQLQQQMHQRQINPAFPQPGQQPVSQPQGEAREATASASPTPAQASNPEANPAPDSTARRVYHERDYATDRVWREDDHTATALQQQEVRPERRHTDKTSNAASSQVGRQDRVEIHEGAALSFSPVRSGPAQGPMQSPPGVPAQGPLAPQPGVPQPYEADALSYHSAMAHPYYQVPPSTPAQTPERSVDPRVRQISDLSALSLQGGPVVPQMYPNGAPVHPHYAQGLLYPPALPPHLAGLYAQQQQQQQQLVDSYLQAQAAGQRPVHANDAEGKPTLKTTHEDRVHTPAPSTLDLDASAPSRLKGHQYSNPPPKSGGKRVSFSTLEIRTYETILGDNPSCSAGPSLGLGWRYDPSHATATVDEYESHLAQMYGTDPDGTARTIPPEDLVLHRHEREAILLNTGYTRQDLAESVRQTNKVKNKRRQTVHNLPVSFLEERAEATRRTLRRWVLKKGRTRGMYEEWKRSGTGGGGRRHSM